MVHGIRVAIYVRVSTQDQSCEIQRNDLEAYVSARGWAVHAVYEDKATGTNANRPMLKQLMNEARERKFDVLLVWKLDRFARSLKDLVFMLQELSELGVDFVSVKDSIDMSTAAGRLMTHLLGAFAEFEASLIRERVRAGIKNAQTKGRRLGRPRLRNDERITKLRSEGRSIREIAKETGVSAGAVQRSLREN